MENLENKKLEKEGEAEKDKAARILFRKMSLGEPDRLAIQAVEEGLKQEKEGIQTFTEFDRVFDEVKQSLLSISIIESVNHLSEADKRTLIIFKNEKEKKGFPPSLEGATRFEIEANLTRRLLENYRLSDREGLGKISQWYGTLEEQGKKLDESEWEPTEKNTLTCYSAGKVGPFSNETTAEHIQWLGTNYTMGVLLKINQEKLAKLLDHLVEFIQKEQTKIQREITLSDRYQNAIGEYENKYSKNRWRVLKELRELYLDMEIERKDKVISIGERMEEMYRLIHSFVMQIES